MVLFSSSKQQTCSVVLYFLQFMVQVSGAACKQGVEVIKPKKNKHKNKSISSRDRQNVKDGADLM